MAILVRSKDIEDASPGDKFACCACGVSTDDPEEVRIGGWTPSGGSQDELCAPLLMVCGGFLLCRGCYDRDRNDRLGLAESEETGWWEL